MIKKFNKFMSEKWHNYYYLNKQGKIQYHQSNKDFGLNKIEKLKIEKLSLNNNYTVIRNLENTIDDFLKNDILKILYKNDFENEIFKSNINLDDINLQIEIEKFPDLEILKQITNQNYDFLKEALILKITIKPNKESPIELFPLLIIKTNSENEINEIEKKFEKLEKIEELNSKEFESDLNLSKIKSIFKNGTEFYINKNYSKIIKNKLYKKIQENFNNTKNLKNFNNTKNLENFYVLEMKNIKFNDCENDLFDIRFKVCDLNYNILHLFNENKKNNNYLDTIKNNAEHEAGIDLSKTDVLNYCNDKSFLTVHELREFNKTKDNKIEPFKKLEFSEDEKNKIKDFFNPPNANVNIGDQNIQNQDMQNQNMQNQDMQNQDMQNQNVQNQNVQNQNVQNQNVQNQINLEEILKEITEKLKKFLENNFDFSSKKPIQVTEELKTKDINNHIVKVNFLTKSIENFEKLNKELKLNHNVLDVAFVLNIYIEKNYENKFIKQILIIQKFLFSDEEKNKIKTEIMKQIRKPTNSKKIETEEENKKPLKTEQLYEDKINEGIANLEKIFAKEIKNLIISSKKSYEENYLNSEETTEKFNALENEILKERNLSKIINKKIEHLNYILEKHEKLINFVEASKFIATSLGEIIFSEEKDKKLTDLIKNIENLEFLKNLNEELSKLETISEKIESLKNKKPEGLIKYIDEIKHSDDINTNLLKIEAFNEKMEFLKNEKLTDLIKNIEDLELLKDKKEILTNSIEDIKNIHFLENTYAIQSKLKKNIEKINSLITKNHNEVIEKINHKNTLINIYNDEKKEKDMRYLEKTNIKNYFPINVNKEITIYRKKFLIYAEICYEEKGMVVKNLRIEPKKVFNEQIEKKQLEEEEKKKKEQEEIKKLKKQIFDLIEKVKDSLKNYNNVIQQSYKIIKEYEKTEKEHRKFLKTREFLNKK